MRAYSIGFIAALAVGMVALTDWSFGLLEVGKKTGLQSDVDPTDTPVAFPLKLGPLNRCLVDQYNVPFLIHGDSPWSLIVSLTKPEVEQYLRVRRKQGFNAIVLDLIEHYLGGGDNKKGAPFNRAGQAPFLVPGDFTQPNEDYFAHADWVLRRAGELGFVVFVFPCYLGYPNSEEGWYREVKANGVEACRGYGRYLGRRYAKMQNLIWVAGGDRNPDDVRPQMVALVEGIRECDKSKLWTAHCFPENSAADQYGDQSWLAINSTYTHNDVAGKCLEDYSREPTRPSFLLESNYENDVRRRTAEDTRKQAWLAALSGACGQFFGNRPVFLFDKGWPPALISSGARYQAYLRRCLLSRHWENLVPESGRRLLPDGLGTGVDRKAAAMTRDSMTALIYLPHGGQVAVELPVFEGPQVKAWWFNPRECTNQDAGIHATNNHRIFSAPSGGDWVLVLDSISHQVPPPGTRNVFESSSTNQRVTIQ